MTFTGFLFILLLVVGVWAGVQLFQGYYADTKIEAHLTEVVLKHRREQNDAVVIEAIVTEVKSRDGVELNPSQIKILRSSDGTRMNVEAPYVYTVKIPLIDKTWNIAFTARIEEDLSRAP